MQTMNRQTIVSGSDAIISIIDTVKAVEKMILAKGERPSTALIIGYISMMTTRVLDDVDRKMKEEERDGGTDE